MKADAAGDGGDAGRDVDEFAADRAGPGLAEGACGEDTGGAGEVVGRDRGKNAKGMCGSALSFKSALTCSILGTSPGGGGPPSGQRWSR